MAGSAGTRGLIRLLAIGFVCSLASQMSALEYWPWFPEPLLPQAILSYQFLTFPKVQTFDHSLNRHETAHTGSANLCFAPTDAILFQTEVALTGTTAHGFFFDYAAVAPQYLIWNDIIGDPLSLSVGGALIVPSTTSRRDFATFHLGSVDFQGHVAIGKEAAACGTWRRRMWAVGAIMASTRGSPAMWGTLAVALNRHDHFSAELYGTGLFGFGHRQLSAFVPFQGYGPFATRAIDIGIRFSVALRYLGVGRLEYRIRPVARNFPQNAQFLIVSVVIPIGF